MKLTKPVPILLAMTPPPILRESLLGYVLRVSEANGYDSLYQIIRHAGITKYKINANTLSADPIAQIVGHRAEELQKLPWQCYPNGQSVPAIVRGTPALLRHIDINSPKICPDCIAENGIVEAIWDLKIIVACPVHGTPLVTACSICEKPLTWYRPRLAVCRCGAKIAPETAPLVSLRSLAFLKIIQKVLYGDKTPLSNNDAVGMPQADLLQMHPGDLLNLIQRIRLFVVFRDRSGAAMANKSYTTAELDSIAAVFEKWPTGFHELLRHVDPQLVGTSNAATVRLRFERIYKNLLYRKPQKAGTLDFVRDAFIRFGITKGNGVYVDPRMQNSAGIADNACQVVTARALAKLVGVTHATVKSLADMGLAKKVTIRTSTGKTRSFYEVFDTIPKSNPSGSMKVRLAAAELNIPVSVLTALRKAGVYKTEYLGRTSKSYHRKDLETLRQKVVDALPAITVADGPDRIKLEAAFRMKLLTTRAKAHLVELIFTRRIQPLGRTGSEIPDVIISRSDLDEFVRSEIFDKDDVLSGHRAARMLRCDRIVIQFLIGSGQLEGVITPYHMRVTKASLDGFASRYVSCAWISEIAGTSTRGILKVCRTHGIEPLWIAAKKRGRNQPFLDRSYLGIFGIGSLPTYFAYLP